MDDLERRIRAAAPSRSPATAPAPKRVADAISAADRRRRGRILIGSIGFAALAGVLLTATLLTGDRQITSVVVAPSPTSTSEPSETTSPTTTAAAVTPTVPVPTTISAQTATTVRASTSTTLQPRPGTPQVGPGTWTMGLDDGELQQIEGTTSLVAPPWSPTGDRVALVQPGVIVKVDVDPPHSRQTVVSGASTAAKCVDWSSRGDLGWVNQDGDVFIARDDDTAGRRVATDALPPSEPYSQEVAECRWSPDGASLVVASSTQLTLVHRDGTAGPVWTTGRREADPYRTSTIEWSPDSRRIGILRPPPGGSESVLFVIDSDGPMPAEPAFRAPVEGQAVHHLSWRQGSRELIVQVGRDSSSSQHLVDTVAGTSTQLASSGCCQRLDTLADGRLLAFLPSSEHGWRKVLAVVDADLATPRHLVAGMPPDPNGSPSSQCRGTYLLDKRASPDARRVVFTAGASYGPRCDSPVF